MIQVYLRIEPQPTERLQRFLALLKNTPTNHNMEYAEAVADVLSSWQIQLKRIPSFNKIQLIIVGTIKSILRRTHSGFMGFLKNARVRKAYQEYSNQGYWSTLDGPEGQIDSLANVSFCFWDFMLPILLHGARHDDQGSMPCQKRLGLSCCVVSDTELSSRP